MAVSILATLFQKEKRLEEALPWLEHTLRYAKKRNPNTIGPELPQYWAVLCARIATLQNDEAYPMAREGLDIMIAKNGINHINNGVGRFLLAAIHINTGEYKEARTLLERNIRMYETKKQTGWEYHTCNALLLSLQSIESPDAPGLLEELTQALEAMEAYEQTIPPHQRFLIEQVRDRWNTLKDKKTPAPKTT